MLLYTLLVVALTLSVSTGLLFFLISLMSHNMKRPWLQFPLYLVWPVSVVAVYLWVWLTNWTNQNCWIRHSWKETGREGYWVQRTCEDCGKITTEWLDQWGKV